MHTPDGRGFAKSKLICHMPTVITHFSEHNIAQESLTSPLSKLLTPFCVQYTNITRYIKCLELKMVIYNEISIDEMHYYIDNYVDE